MYLNCTYFNERPQKIFVCFPHPVPIPNHLVSKKYAIVSSSLWSMVGKCIVCGCSGSKLVQRRDISLILWDETKLTRPLSTPSAVTARQKEESLALFCHNREMAAQWHAESSFMILAVTSLNTYSKDEWILCESWCVCSDGTCCTVLSD